MGDSDTTGGSTTVAVTSIHTVMIRAHRERDLQLTEY